jgi:SAM-dependent methyltransferase
MSQFAYYDHLFYEQRITGSLKSAMEIIPLVLKLFPVKSVVDIGCGLGTWLRAFQEYGVSDILGIDGPHIEEPMLEIRKEAFTRADLCTNLHLSRSYDLAISLEVAEHLGEEYATQFINTLTDASEIVLFSAAIPGQSGRGHINLQWQDYWREIFNSFGYTALDAIRPQIWGHPDVDYWYQQNIIIYCSHLMIESNSWIKQTPKTRTLNMVHPALYLSKIQEDEDKLRIFREHLSLTEVVSVIPSLAKKALWRRLYLRGKC